MEINIGKLKKVIKYLISNTEEYNKAEVDVGTLIRNNGEEFDVVISLVRREDEYGENSICITQLEE